MRRDLSFWFVAARSFEVRMFESLVEICVGQMMRQVVFDAVFGPSYAAISVFLMCFFLGVVLREFFMTA
jgi:hypothetical protein